MKSRLWQLHSGNVAPISRESIADRLPINPASIGLVPTLLQCACAAYPAYIHTFLWQRPAHRNTDKPPAFSPLLFDSLQTKIPPPQKKNPANPHQNARARRKPILFGQQQAQGMFSGPFLPAMLIPATCDAYCSFFKVDFALLSLILAPSPPPPSVTRISIPTRHLAWHWFCFSLAALCSGLGRERGDTCVFTSNVGRKLRIVNWMADVDGPQYAVV